MAGGRGQSVVYVTEAYSPERVTARAKQFGLRPGDVFDVTCNDEDCNPYDLSKPEMRQTVRRRIQQRRPRVLIGSPFCTMFSQMLRISWHNMDLAERTRRMEESRMHLNFDCELYLDKVRAGCYFTYEHPQQASSRDAECTKRVLRIRNAQKMRIHMCQHGMVTVDPEGNEFPVLKPTYLMTNMPAAQVCLSKKRLGDREGATPGGQRRTQLARVYPRKFVDARLRSIRLQAQWGEGSVYMLGVVGSGGQGDGQPIPPGVHGGVGRHQW